MLQKVAETSFALVNNSGYPMVAWTLPDDGFDHRVEIVSRLEVTEQMTGGVTGIVVSEPGKIADSGPPLFNPGNVGVYHYQGGCASLLVGSGAVVSVMQVSNLTVGAATLRVQIWADA